MTTTWWWAPLLAVLRGIALGFAVVFVITRLPAHAQPWAIGVVVVVAVLFLVWMLRDLRRLQQRTLTDLDDLERMWRQ